jgi:CheY-like chemotaxis protein
VGGKLILLVEDNPDDANLTIRALKKGNITNEIVVARDGTEALDYLLGTGAYKDHDTSTMRGLSGDSILEEARVLAVADVIEAIASNRPYRPAFTLERALDMIRKNKEILYDPDVVEACLRLFEKGFNFNEF